MCYFYANPLSVFLQDGGKDDYNDTNNTQETLLQNPDYLAAIRQLPSFRRHVEALVADGDMDAAKQLLLGGGDKDSSSTQHHHLRQAVADQLQYQRRWNRRLARALQLASASGVFAGQSFTELYITALEDRRGGNEEAFTLDDDDTSLAATLTSAIRRMSSAELVTLVRRLVVAVQAGDPDLALEPAAGDHSESADAEKEGEKEEEEDAYEKNWRTLAANLTAIADQVEELQKKLEASHASSRNRSRMMALKVTGGPNSPSGSGSSTFSGTPQLRSKYTAQSKVLRTTVVAQKVQLSRDSAALTEEDQAFTELVDAAVGAVVGVVDIEPVTAGTAATTTTTTGQLWLQEIWLYDARTPYRDVFIPRPGLVVERALARPHDYLACTCCAGTGRKKSSNDNDDARRGSIRPTLPATAILYQLYLEAGPLINVADLWEAFQTVVSDSGNNGDKENKETSKENTEDNGDEEGEEQEEGEEEDTQERRNLVQFYQGLSEMKTLGYIKATRRKVDHVAKIKWL